MRDADGLGLLTIVFSSLIKRSFIFSLFLFTQSMIVNSLAIELKYD